MKRTKKTKRKEELGTAWHAGHESCHWGLNVGRLCLIKQHREHYMLFACVWGLFVSISFLWKKDERLMKSPYCLPEYPPPPPNIFVFCVVYVASKESRRLVLPRTCLYFWFLVTARSVGQIIACNGRIIMNLKGLGRKQPLPNLRYYPCIWLEGLRKTTSNRGQDNQCPDRVLNTRYPKYEGSGVIHAERVWNEARRACSVVLVRHMSVVFSCQYGWFWILSFAS
jgi:hypothetical protein